MDKLIYTAAVAAKNAMDRQANVANNVANVNTPGFRAQLLAHRTSPLTSKDGMPTRAMSMETITGYDSAQGMLQQTGRKLDFGLQTEGWFAVQNNQGDEVYTRAGHFVLNAQNQLVTTAGTPVIGANGGAIEIPQGFEFEISDNGTISGYQNTPQGPAQIVNIDRLKLVNPPKDQMTRGEDGFFVFNGGQVADLNENVRVAPGFLEASNVNPVDSMVKMISAGREFEANMKILSMEEQNSQASNNLLSLN